MTFDKNSNGFTFGFAVVMVVVVGALLSIAAMGLKPRQEENVRREKMQNILSAIQISVSAEDAQSQYDKYVVEEIVLDNTGGIVEGIRAFNVDIQKQYKEFKSGIRKNTELEFPLFRCEKDGETFYVVPLVGTGLWGPIWGYLALKDDLNSIYGATFDHKSETPGLGAEIKEGIFLQQFTGDKVYNNGVVELSVLKGGGGAENEFGVDGITGGTITSRGVDEMLKRTLSVYQPYFETIRN
ncbi:MAG: NADH:ubiquinone reductase (Na(+)-transporting) subunit C [Flavobacteriales bacterium]|jgi:Na+-transporting NADH:ubiquinone oxidoreductase subunit C|nr:NADH:ubiquinone reductase (Na(+)-transporting) subunit C [Flavobacteriales bacterium]